MPIGTIPQQNTLESQEKFNMKVLLADDEGFVREATAMFLKHFGCTVEEVADGKALLSRLDSAKPGEFGLIMTDNNMPGMTGTEAIEKFRKDARFEKIPVILYSGLLLPEVEKKVKESGGLSIEKPFEMSALKAKIKEAVAKSIK